eukprot:m.124516 g.124516  ORF g.124516 m.124516 type:complete len:633 (+) comp13776_c0_seq13:28-1926(+)
MVSVPRWTGLAHRKALCRLAGMQNTHLITRAAHNAPPSSTTPPQKGQCWKCGGKGHTSANCTAPTSEVFDPNMQEGHAYRHIPVLYHEVLANIAPLNHPLRTVALTATPSSLESVPLAKRPKWLSRATFLDLTFGAGGHTRGILEHFDVGQMYCADGDSTAISIAQRLKQSMKRRVTDKQQEKLKVKEKPSGKGKFMTSTAQMNILQCKMSAVTHNLQETYGMRKPVLDGVVLDAGLSSMQLDEEDGRGFSFLSDSPLNAMMSPYSLVPASMFVNFLPTSLLSQIIWTFGEDRESKIIASQIKQKAKSEPIRTASQLARVVQQALEKQRGRRDRGNQSAKIHPATKTFLALRTVVNSELSDFELGIASVLPLVRVGGRVCLITFNDLERRIQDKVMAQFRPRSTTVAQLGERAQSASSEHSTTDGESAPHYAMNNSMAQRWELRRDCLVALLKHRSAMDAIHKRSSQLKLWHHQKELSQKHKNARNGKDAIDGHDGDRADKRNEKEEANANGDVSKTKEEVEEQKTLPWFLQQTLSKQQWETLSRLDQTIVGNMSDLDALAYIISLQLLPNFSADDLSTVTPPKIPMVNGLTFRKVTRNPVAPSATELARNNRARSAQLTVYARVSNKSTAT